jgi:hypothetical protein
MPRVLLRWYLAPIHSGCPFQFDVEPTTTIGEICEMVKAQNDKWWGVNLSTHPYKSVNICGPNNTFLDKGMVIGSGHHQNECVMVFVA